MGIMSELLSFASDYMEGAHPEILRRLAETNLEQTAGYGLDEYSEAAREKIRRACRAPRAEVHFLSGGTQVNRIVISSLLRPYEGVVAANTGHITVHEAGAIECGGHKVLALPHENGKLTAHAIEGALRAYNEDANRDHTVYPGMIYISHPTEYGTLYTMNELEAISATDGLYERGGAHAVAMADRIRAALTAKNYRLASDAPTNQIFLVLDAAQLARLSEHVVMGFWEKQGDVTVMRIATSWATRAEDVDRLIALL